MKYTTGTGTDRSLTTGTGTAYGRGTGTRTGTGTATLLSTGTGTPNGTPTGWGTGTGTGMGWGHPQLKKNILNELFGQLDKMERDKPGLTAARTAASATSKAVH